MQDNNFQAVVTTNGQQSYTVFTYQCGELNWVPSNSATSIGFSASPTSFANHPLSHQSNVNDIACLNQQVSPWTNVVYQIGKKLIGNDKVIIAYSLFANVVLHVKYYSLSLNIGELNKVTRYT